MKDQGIDKGSVFHFDTSKKPRGINKGIFGFRKMFWDYLNKLNVPFYDPCCVEAPTSNSPVRFNTETGSFEIFNGTAWVAADDAGGTVTSLTAHSGGGQGSATQLAGGFNEVTTVAVAADSVKLPAAAAGSFVVVKNDGANAMDVFPATGDTINDGSANAAVSIGAGVVASFRAVNTTDWESDTQAGQYSTITTGAVTEIVAGAGIAANQTLIEKHSTFAVNITATVAAANFAKAYFTSTSAAAVTLTLDTAANIATAIGATQGTVVDFYVDNTAGANTVTVAVNTGITAATPVITGGNTLTVSTANAIGVFRLVFSSTSVAKLFRIG